MKYLNGTALAAACLALVFFATGCGKLNPKTEGQIYSALEAKNDNFQKCYSKALKENRNIKGKVDLKLQFDSNGVSPKKVTVAKSNIKNKKMLKCVKKTADKIRIQDAPGVSVEGQYTVNFDFK
jgi:hypothetical protein